MRVAQQSQISRCPDPCKRPATIKVCRPFLFQEHRFKNSGFCPLLIHRAGDVFLSRYERLGAAFKAELITGGWCASQIHFGRDDVL